MLSEDSDMNYRILQSGGKVYFNPDIEMFCYPRETMRGLAQLYFRYGGARAGNVLKHGKPTSFRQLAPLIFVTGTLTTGILALLNSWFLALFAVMTGTYLAADIAVSVALGVQDKRLSLIPHLLVAFPCIHFCWAFGFFRRVFQGRHSARRWGY